MANKQANGKKAQLEQSVFSKLNEIVPSQSKVYYIMWKYARHLLPQEINTFDDLVSTYKIFTDGMTEKHCENWLSEEAVQSAVMYLLKRLHQQKLIELYNTYFDKAKDDVQAFKAFMDFSDKFFADTGEDELRAVLRDIQINENE